MSVLDSMGVVAGVGTLKGVFRKGGGFQPVGMGGRVFSVREQN